MPSSTRRGLSPPYVSAALGRGRGNRQKQLQRQQRTLRLAVYRRHLAAVQLHLLQQALVVTEHAFVAPTPAIQLRRGAAAELLPVQDVGQQPRSEERRVG